MRSRLYPARSSSSAVLSWSPGTKPTSAELFIFSDSFHHLPERCGLVLLGAHLVQVNEAVLHLRLRSGVEINCNSVRKIPPYIYPLTTFHI